jgi:hypothetical protein
MYRYTLGKSTDVRRTEIRISGNDGYYPTVRSKKRGGSRMKIYVS